MNESIKNIFVRFIDGTNVFIPIQGQIISEGIYELLPNDEFNYEDKNILFEFGSGDTVEVKLNKFDDGKSGLMANRLVKLGNSNNSFKRLAFSILYYSLSFNEAIKLFDKSDIIKLVNFIEGKDFVYPAIKEFVEKNKKRIINIG